METSCLTVPEARSLGWRGPQGWFFMRSMREDLFQVFLPDPSCLLAFWWSLACTCINLISAFMITWHFPCVHDSFCVQVFPFHRDSHWIRAHPSDHLQRHYFHIRSHSQVLRVGTKYLLRCTVQFAKPLCSHSPAQMWKADAAVPRYCPTWVYCSLHNVPFLFPELLWMEKQRRKTSYLFRREQWKSALAREQSQQEVGVGPWSFFFFLSRLSYTSR